MFTPAARASSPNMHGPIIYLVLQYRVNSGESPESQSNLPFRPVALQPQRYFSGQFRISEEYSGSGATMPDEIKPDPALPAPPPPPSTPPQSDRGIGHVS